MTVLFFISFFFFVAGIAATVWLYGVPSSVSAVYYLLPERFRTALFYAWTVAVAFPLTVFWLEVSKGSGQALIFLGCALVTGVGVTAAFRDRSVRRAHILCSVGAVALTQAWICLFTPFWFFSVASVLPLCVTGSRVAAVSDGRERRSAWLFFLELAAFLSVYMSVYSFALPT